MLKAVNEAQTIERGVKAERILTDPLYTEAYERVRGALLAKFESSPARDKDGREYLYLMLKALNDARGHLEQAMRDGKYTLTLKSEQRRFNLFR